MSLSMTAHYNGLAQDCGNSSANALELLQFCAQPSINPLNIDTLRPSDAYMRQ